MLELDLQKLGLNEKEVKVYLAALELGYSPMQDIAKKAGVNRATAYFIIDGLIKKGLVTQIEKNKKTYFAAEDPKSLITIIDKKWKEAEEVQSVFKQILPQLESVYNLSVEKPKIRYYEGIDGIGAMRSEFLQVTGKEVVGFTNLNQLFKFFPQHDQEYRDKRVKREVKSRVLYTNQSGPIENATSQK